MSFSWKRWLRTAAAFALVFGVTTSCAMDRAPLGLRRTPAGSGASVRFDLGGRPKAEIPLPNDTATWPDPTSRTGLRINTSLAAATMVEQNAREKFASLEGWGTFAPISVAFDLDRGDSVYKGYAGPALDLANVKARHQGDDYDFADDAVYLVNLKTGVPVPLDLGAGNFGYTVADPGRYWTNDTHRTERNVVFETLDETQRGTITPATFLPEHDADFDGALDQPNLDDPGACPGPDADCDDPHSPSYDTIACQATRRARDRCLADHLLTWYERETDTLLLRPILPLDEMTPYAVVLTDRLVDGKGNPVKSPFDLVYHASMEGTAARVKAIVNDDNLKRYFGDLAATGLDHVAFTWSFTTQPTADDLRRLRDGLYGQGVFGRWGQQYPPRIEVDRAVGLTRGLAGGAKDAPGFATSEAGKQAGCGPLVAKGLYVVKYDAIRAALHDLAVGALGLPEGPASALLLRSFGSIDHLVVGTYRSPFLLAGGPRSTDPGAAFHLNFLTGQGDETEGTVQFWLVVPKETAEHTQPFNVAIYGHGVSSNVAELLLYAGNMAQQGLATIGINAAGHGLGWGDATTARAADEWFRGACVAPLLDAMVETRARDLDGDGIPDSGGDFWSSYPFHTRDGVRQSVLDQIQLVKILRAFGTPSGQMVCRSEATGWAEPKAAACDLDGDGKPEIAGDFDFDGRPDVGGPTATYGAWGTSLGGIVAGIQGAIDPFVTSAVSSAGGGGLADIGARSFDRGIAEGTLLRLWGPLLVTVAASERASCTAASTDGDRCTLCPAEQMSMRWVMPDRGGAGEIEIGCFSPEDLAETTVFVSNKETGQRACASLGKDARMRVGLPSSKGDAVEIAFFEGKDRVDSYRSCRPTGSDGLHAKITVARWGQGRFAKGSANDAATETCASATCARFQGHFYGEGNPLTAPADGFGLIRQTPETRRFLALAQTAFEPGDPVTFAPFYARRSLPSPEGSPMRPHGLLTLTTIGDMRMPVSAGIAFARASGALPFLRPDEADRFPEYADFVTPEGLYRALGNRTPNRLLVDDHVVEGVAALARHPAGAACPPSANEKARNATFLAEGGAVKACFPTGCTQASEANPRTRRCYDATHCEGDSATTSGRCVPDPLGQATCDEALFDVDDLDEESAGYFEQNAPTPLRLARYARPVSTTGGGIDAVWRPRLDGAPHREDGTWKAETGRPITALLNAYVAPEGAHRFANGEPCRGWDAGTYLTNLTARFLLSDGADLYYLSHPTSHHCLEDAAACGDGSSP